MKTPKWKSRGRDKENTQTYIFQDLYPLLFKTGNLHYDLPVTLMGGKEEKQDRPE
jgi:hypothetical protein